MDRRFESVFDVLMDRRSGRPLGAVLRESANEELVAALAAAGGKDAVAANAIATELLNRLRRAPFLGAFYVGLAIFVSIYALDYAITGSFLLMHHDARSNMLALLSLVVAVLSGILLLMWRGAFRDLRMAILRRFSRGY